MSTAAKLIPDPVIACTKLVYDKMGVKPTPEGAVGGGPDEAAGLVRMDSGASSLPLSLCLLNPFPTACTCCSVRELSESCGVRGLSLTAEPFMCGLQMLWILSGNKSLPLQSDQTFVTLVREREAAVLNVPLTPKQFDFQAHLGGQVTPGLPSRASLGCTLLISGVPCYAYSVAIYSHRRAVCSSKIIEHVWDFLCRA